MPKTTPALVLHGGAGALAVRDYARELDHMRGLAEAGRDALHAGARALDVAMETVAAMEAAGFYVAGRGAAPNSAGKFELDASLMDGPTRRADPRRPGGDGQDAACAARGRGGRGAGGGRGIGAGGG